MIIEIIHRRDANDALEYGAHVGKHATPDGPAEEIDGSLLPGARLEDYYSEFERVHALRPEIKRNVIHIIVSFAPEDGRRDQVELSEITRKVLGKLGYGDCPFRETEHTDKQFQHLHCVTSIVNYSGERIDRTGDRNKAQRIARAIEREHGLWRAPSVKGGPVLPPLPIPGTISVLQKPAAPMLLWESRVKHMADQVIRPGITLPQFHDELLALGVSLEPKWTQDRTKITGLGYRFEGRQKNASQIDRGLSLNGLKNAGVSYDPVRDVPILTKPGTATPKYLPLPLTLPLLAAPTIRTAAALPKLPPPPRLNPEVHHVRPQVVSTRKPFLQTAWEFATRLWDAIRRPGPIQPKPRLSNR
ncbi:relaxase/mobilization nuclease domain-containing protein [Geothrix sp. 21YS21S-2]|uniref:relaxase/mobilization nuclease domain-containing protein n=1 Tax=Geothrix sp. 21YS21S-2 TaxID=3068893 RepID=UPI0027B9D914|nr:relaxase/mobilization nuclease domain-containing protein [Geothrix sp. 21YS21S-2]